ncbi:hypothetical protein HIM_06495 [Hirsutella minnesotensis 3608]|uniref:Uncharacterized protein n=1 Tax=Hirsutella minnesotensis 3608 TaxID=1043627 RepID=A0A0F7ZIX2_9HYPO|nr:hypothetical protein HIM_06495 [Hirsutella minnesotensis 3608]
MAAHPMIPPGVACAEAVSLLHLLHPVPAKPSINNPPGWMDVGGGAHVLPLASESSLASTLAFLSSVKDDPNHVSALCIHEDPTTTTLNVLIAVNQARQGDGTSYLRRVERGFNEIFTLLSKAHETKNTEDQAFSGIVSMCSDRILSRMRLATHKRKQPRQTIMILLQETITLVGAEFPDYRQKAQTVVKLLNQWTKHQTRQRLGHVVDAILQLSRTSDLPRLLGSIPNATMGPSERSNLLRMITRVGRYREAARFLYRLAKKHEIARHMRTIRVSLPQSAFLQASNEYAPDLRSVLARLGMMDSRFDFGQFSYILSKRGAVAENEFAKQCKKTASEGKVHAEMQLVYYCEMNKPYPHPRVIASSKMACFLCNSFICHMTKFYTTRCHGRLYPGWKLPILPSSDLERRFAQILEKQIKSSVKTLLSKQKRTAYPQPSESTLWTFKSSATTVNMGVQGGERHLGREISDHNVEVHPHSTAEITLHADPCPTNESESTSGMAMNANLTSQLEKKLPLAGSSTPSVSMDMQPETEEYVLQPGRPKSTAVQAGQSSRFFEAWPLRLQIEYSIVPKYPEQKQSETNLDCTIEWLTPKDADLINIDETIEIVNAESMGSELLISVGDQNSLYISAGGALLKVGIGGGILR